MKNEKNHIKEGIKATSKLRKSFYQFLYDKHIDWAILIGSFFLLLPYLGSKQTYFLLIKLILFLVFIYVSVRYLLNWKELDSFKKIWKEAQNTFAKLLKNEKIKDVNSPSTHSKIEELIKTYSEIFPDFKLMAEKKLSPEELQKKHPEQITKLLDILNEDIDLTSTVVGSSLLGLGIIQIIRTIPMIELLNYRRILYILGIDLIFFIVYTIEASIKIAN
jgi:hypothetical protein